MTDSMKGKVIAITGGSSGIGLALSQLLASRGAIVCIADINPYTLRDASSFFSEHEVPHLLTKLDVTVRGEVDAWIEGIIEQFGRLDGAANCAAIIGKHHGIRALTEQDDDEWDSIMAVNLKGVMSCMRAELKVIEAGGSIVNVASILGTMGYALHGAYVAAKHGVIGLTRTAAKENGSKGIRVNAVAPGAIRTPMLDAGDKIAKITKHEEPNAMGRVGEPIEIAGVIAFLLGPDSTYVSGMVYGADGGWAC